MTNFRMLMLAALILCSAVAAYAQDDDTDDDVDDDTTDDDATDDDTTDDDATDDDATDDDAAGDFDATLAFTSPVAIEPNIQYDFEFQVTNTTSASSLQQWIDLVDLYMPSEDYILDAANIADPDDLHGGAWTHELLAGDATDIGIRWIFTSGSTSEAYGDVREGEFQMFAFRATVDDAATDGFDYKIHSDSGQFVEGTACIVPGCDNMDDDDTGGDDDDDDDDADEGDDDDDDDDSGCCG